LKQQQLQQQHQQQHQHQHQQLTTVTHTTTATATKKKRITRRSTKGTRQRDVMDIFANILEILTRQVNYNLKNIKRCGKNFIGKYRRDDSIVSLNSIKSKVGLSTLTLNEHTKTLREEGMITLDVFRWRNTRSMGKRKSAVVVRKIFKITAKGSRFLHVYREMRDLLTFPIV
jgi:predicted transcriptional regulator